MEIQEKQKESSLKVTCFFEKDGLDIEQIIKQSFEMFVKSELIKQCG